MSALLERRRTAVLTAAALVAAALTSVIGVTSAGPAEAASTCTGNASILATDGTTGAMRLYTFNSPGAATSTVTQSTFTTMATSGFSRANYSRIFGGPNGYVYAIASSTPLTGQTAGGLYYWHWTGTAFDVKAKAVIRDDGTPSTGWSGYGSGGFRYRISMDKSGNIYHYNSSGQLKRTALDVTTGKILQGDHVIADWGTAYDAISAAGDGAIFARKSTGAVDRYDYDPASDRMYSRGTQGTQITTGWNAYTNGFFSVGGEVLLGIKADGTMWHHVYNAPTTLTSVGQFVVNNRQVGTVTTWSTFSNVSAFTSTCNEPTDTFTPAAPAITGSSFAPISVAVRTAPAGAAAPIDYGIVDNLGRLITLRQSTQDFTSSLGPPTVISGAEAYSGRPAMIESPTGALYIHALNRSSHIWRRWESPLATVPAAAGRWADHRGVVSGAPVSVKLASGLVATFATASTGELLVQRQLDTTSDNSRVWQNLDKVQQTAPTITTFPVGPFALGALDADRVAVATITANGALWVGVYNPASTALPTWTNLGGTFTGTPAVVVAPGFLVRVVARGTAGDLQTKAQTVKDGAFPAGWTSMGSAPVGLAGSPSVIISPVDGLVTTLSRGTDGGIWGVQESGQACGTFGAWWQILTPPFTGTGAYVSDPTPFAATTTNGVQWGFATYDSTFAPTIVYQTGIQPPAPTGCLTAGAARTTGRASLSSVGTHPTFAILRGAAPPS